MKTLPRRKKEKESASGLHRGEKKKVEKRTEKIEREEGFEKRG